MSQPLPNAAVVNAAVLTTWPAARLERVGPWTVREGAGAGSRVSSATVEAEWDEADILSAEEAMRSFAQVPQFMVREGEEPLDRALAARGYVVKDPTRLYVGESSVLAGDRRIKASTGYAMWPPLHAIRDIWQDGGIGPARQAVMERAPRPKVGILSRAKDTPAGAAFAAVDGEIAVLHAVHVLPAFRRKGVARHLIKHAAIWALDQEAPFLALAVTQGNVAGNALYNGLGMRAVGQYHYRIQTEGGGDG